MTGKNTKIQDPLFFPRTELATRLVNVIESGYSHAFTLFAPRRMGKTTFLLEDVAPLAKAKGFRVFYFSFMDDTYKNIARMFTQALEDFSNSKTKLFIHRIKSIKAFSLALDKEVVKEQERPVSAILNQLAKQSVPTLVLLDEVQELARDNSMQGLISSLRTGLDINKHKLTTIFTGSSLNRLQTMFNAKNAPFFHFANDLSFPNLDKNFTDFLAHIYQQRTQQILDKNHLYSVFTKLNYSPMLIRLIIQDMIINPELSLKDAARNRFVKISLDDGFIQIWNALADLEKVLITKIAQAQTTNTEFKVYAEEEKMQLTEQLGINLTNTNIQNAIRKLQNRDLIAKNPRNEWIVCDPSFKSWLIESGNS